MGPACKCCVCPISVDPKTAPRLCLLRVCVPNTSFPRTQPTDLQLTRAPAPSSQPTRQNRQIEIGRIAVINYGDDNGKIGAIVEVCDSMTALFDGPGIKRGLLNYRRMALTDIVLPIQRGVKTSTLNAKWKEADVDGQYAKTTWGQKAARAKRRAALTDFERFKVRTLKAKKSKIIKQKVKQLKKSA